MCNLAPGALFKAKREEVKSIKGILNAIRELGRASDMNVDSRRFLVKMSLIGLSFYCGRDTKLFELVLKRAIKAGGSE